MFTGLIEEVGTIQNVRRGARSCVLTIGCKKVLEGSQIGDSIAVNGVCLTVTSMGGSYYTADVMAETMNRSSLRQLSTGASVNLERAMPANGRFGGHIVSGHIDGTGTVQSIEPDDNAIWYTIAAKPNLLRYIVEKGSITIDGISLTIMERTESTFSVSIIPHTLSETVLGHASIGTEVNLETDITGRYIRHFMTLDAPTHTSKSQKSMESLLVENGFM